MKHLDYSEDFMVMLHLIDITSFPKLGLCIETGPNTISTIAASIEDNNFKNN